MAVALLGIWAPAPVARPAPQPPQHRLPTPGTPCPPLVRPATEPRRSFNSLILNHGDRRNHAHLHLKARVNDWAWAAAQAGWPARWREQYAALQEFAASLPAEKRGTREAFLLRQAKRQGGGGS